MRQETNNVKRAERNENDKVKYYAKEKRSRAHTQSKNQSECMSVYIVESPTDLALI